MEHYRQWQQSRVLLLVVSADATFDFVSSLSEKKKQHNGKCKSNTKTTLHARSVSISFSALALGVADAVLFRLGSVW